MAGGIPPRLLIKMAQERGFALEKKPFSLAGTTFRLRPLCANEALGVPLGVAAVTPRWFLAEADPAAATEAELWELSYQAMTARKAFGDGPEVYIEPDIPNPWPYENAVSPGQGLGAAPGGVCAYNERDGKFPPQEVRFAWHLGQDHSQLKEARDRVANGTPALVRLGIMDTGFDFGHRAGPVNWRQDLQRNFVRDGWPDNNASDPYSRGLGRNPGHGTATLGILAGKKLSGMARPEQNGDYLGGAPLAEVIPLRVADGVILLYTSAFAEGLDYLIAPQGNPAGRADVVSMSMGGLASKAWADVVNRAYEAGVCLVTAAGNNFPLTPQTIVYPARFQRVIAACGVMADGRPYIRREVPFGRMAGNYGPVSKMATALAAYTPNMPWAEINCHDIVDMDGQGTSAATPQVAAAAALWLQTYKKQLSYDAPWKIVEAVRRALFSTAKRDHPEYRTFFGQGVLQASAALAVKPASQLGITPPDKARFSFFKVLTGLGLVEPTAQEMLEIEALQLLQRDYRLEQLIQDPEIADLPRQELKEFLEAAIESPLASDTLKNHLKRVYTHTFLGPEVKPQPEPPARREQGGRATPTPPPVFRLLRAYAFDPELSLRLETADINEVVFEVPWEEDLQPGPSGEYVEVIDFDPSSRCFYAPVDLNERHLLATDGLAPSEGNPRFHQQMVYAVVMRTIYNFERALGRKAMWSPRPESNTDPGFVQKLRIFPHALRESNAYYHPGKKALLFGYFPAKASDPGRQYPGGTVFTCLSHDIIAHETTHALLDGLHQNFIWPTNEDQLAFHEAFADIVALFQHFTLPEVVRHQIGKTRGDLRARNILGELAQQFGQASGKRGALRSYIGGEDKTTGQWRPLEPDPTAYQRETRPHYRGALLVAAIFDAFLSIYERRTADLVRLATSGTGILPTGAIHPDLVGRLADEAAKAAQHVLTMCVRALDYCPPVDLTFGDYLRALITADYDLAPVDKLDYRVAFVEAFRRRGIYPLDLRSLSVDALRWRQASEDQTEDLLRPVLSRLREFASRLQHLENRRDIYSRSWEWRLRTRNELQQLFQQSPPSRRQEFMNVLGLDLSLGAGSFEVPSLAVAAKEGIDKSTRPQIILSLSQQQQRRQASGGPSLPFWGGCTIIADQRSAAVKYYISKNILSQTRLERQKTFLEQQDVSLSGVYFSHSPLSGLEERFAMMHADEEEE